MSEPEAAIEPGTLCFRCNICGTSNLVAADTLGREVASCASCGSSGRFRSIVSLLSLELFDANLELPDFPKRPDLVGLGMTDWDGYALRLAEIFSYRNTYYHREPRLDVSANEIPDVMKGNDFVISSDVLEHIVPPVQKAFANIFDMLKPGGCFILTVPYGLQSDTTEHFPDLYEFDISERNGAYVLKNRTKSGVMQEFSELCFHGGPGSTLEMRVFSENALLAHLNTAGFESIKIHPAWDFRHGIWWPQPWGFPISATKPRA
jgi:SAM-dependent methyltransferase